MVDKQWRLDAHEEACSAADNHHCSSMEVRVASVAVRYRSSAAKAEAGCTRMSVGWSMDKARWQPVDQHAVVVISKRLTYSSVPGAVRTEVVPDNVSL